MNERPISHHRCSIRLKGYDYALAGVCFITICAWDHAFSFGEVVEGTIDRIR